MTERRRSRLSLAAGRAARPRTLLATVARTNTKELT